MDLTMLLLFGLVSLVLGAGIMLLAQYYIFFKFCKLPEESEEQRDINEKYSLPKDIQKTARLLNATPSMVTNATHDASTAPLVAINFVMQFLFHELKHSNRVRKWFYRKLSLELDELIAKTTTGKLFDKLTIKELELGDQFPEIKTLRVHNVELDNTEGRIENLDLMLEIKYRGNFRTSIDADMVLGKKGSLTLMVKHLSGLARLQFTRKPYTHWSLSFLGDPELDLAVESKYQGRQMQSNITSLISNQIRKAVRRKHTLPNYKLRYKPFFHKLPEDETGDAEIQSNGVLEVKVSELSRLMCPEHITDVYCTLTMASFAFVEARQKNDRNVVVSLDVQIHKAKNQQIGIVFKQLPEHVEIEAVLPNTPACKSNLRAGDVLIAIEGRRVCTIQQVAKVVKTLQNTGITLRMERVVPGIIRNDAILEDLELYEDLGDLRTGYGAPKLSIDGDMPKVTLSVAGNSLKERANSSESSLNNTPTSSPKKSRLIAKALKRTISRENNDSNKEAAATAAEELRLKAKSTIAKLEERPKNCALRSPGEGVNDVEHYYQHSTVDCTLSSLIHMDDLCQFKLDARCKFLNVCVYGKCPAESQLLGFVNIPIHLLLAECCETSITQCLKTFELNPPIIQDLKSHHLYNQSGFDANLCFGDILFAFTWEGNPILQTTETPSRLVTNRSRARTTSISERTDDSGLGTINSDNISLKSTSSIDLNNSSMINSSNTQSQPRAHNFIRTHFQRATQCDFCGKKIWLKDAVQCRDCFMCCHKKCINKCQNSTVCGPVDCSTALQEPASSSVATPEFTVTEVGGGDSGVGGDIGSADVNIISCDGGSSEGEEALTAFSGEEEAQTKTTPTAVLDVHRSSLTGLLAQSIKRVNSANNLAIPGIVSTLGNTKSLPPSPQHSPSRKQSLVNANINPFELVTHRLESISVELTALSSEQVSFIAEPIINISKNEDVMTLAKSAGKTLFADYEAKMRVEKVNELLTKLRLALDSETAIHSTLILSKNGASPDSSPQSKPSSNRDLTIVQSEERVQALSVIMLYLCTALQHAQGVALQ